MKYKYINVSQIIINYYRHNTNLFIHNRYEYKMVRSLIVSARYFNPKILRVLGYIFRIYLKVSYIASYETRLIKLYTFIPSYNHSFPGKCKPGAIFKAQSSMNNVP